MNKFKNLLARIPCAPLVPSRSAGLCRTEAITILFFLSFILASLAWSSTESRLMRFPDISKDHIVFVYGGDLWLVAREGGIARKITNHEGLEWFPKFSPDGKWIAFTAEYDGNADVYLIPSEGGEPRRLTYSTDGPGGAERMGPNNEVMCWTLDSKYVIYRSRHESISPWYGRLYKVGVEGGFPEPLPLPEGGLTTFSPDGKKIAYNRNFREFRTWKRYRGGQAQDIWIYDFEKNTIENITNNEAQDDFPMWYGDKIYFASDRDHTTNIFVYDLKTKQTKKITNHTEYDVKWPSLGADAIVYENGGYLYVLDLKTEQTKKVSVEIPSDLILVRPRYITVSENATDYSLSPDGKRALFGARGEIFTVPAEKGNTRNLTNTSGARERSSSWSPDGKWIAYISDASGEDEIYIVPQDGKGSAVRITTDGNAFRFAPVWSPDSKKLAYADKNLKLFYVDVDEKEPVLIDTARYGEITQYDWSPDSKWVAYAKVEENRNASIFLYSLEQKRITRVTSDLTSDWEPTFDPEGKYLYFFSRRDFNAVLGNFEASYTYNRMTRIYLVTLQADAPSPFAPQSDEVEIKKPDEQTKEKEKGKEEKETKEKKKELRIELEGIQDRVAVLPITAGEYRGMRVAKGKVFYLSFATSGLSGPASSEKTTLHVFDMEKRKDSEFLSPVDGYDISHNGEKIIYKSGSTYGIVETKGSPKVGDGSLNLSDMQMKLNPREEWKQIFDDVWRQERDFFYASNMVGVDWKAIRERYSQLVPYVAHRSDLTYILGEMIGELCTSHTYVGGGDMPRPKTVSIGHLGVIFEPDQASGYYRIKTILRGENWKEDTRSPLTEPGVNVKEGEYIVAIDGKNLRYPTNPYSLLENTVGKIVTLKVSSKPSDVGAREVMVKPIANEFGLYYHTWVENNRKKVEQATNGRVGYIHIPDMGAPGLNEFVKTYYAQIRKEGLIVDVRYNGGGFVSQMIIERLRRVILQMVSSRNAADGTYPGAVFTGSMVCLINKYSASDGDIFPYAFKQAGLGPLIGERTWGGVVGIRGNIGLVDGGYITRPEFARFSLEGQWIMENHGVDPDIPVDNLPNLVMKGQDPQLEKAIEVIMKDITEHPRKLPERPPYPIKK